MEKEKEQDQEDEDEDGDEEDEEHQDQDQDQDQDQEQEKDKEDESQSQPEATPITPNKPLNPNFHPFTPAGLFTPTTTLGSAREKEKEKEKEVSHLSVLALQIMKHMVNHPLNWSLFDEYEKDLLVLTAAPGKIGQLAAAILADYAKHSIPLDSTNM